MGDDNKSQKLDDYVSTTATLVNGTLGFQGAYYGSTIAVQYANKVRQLINPSQIAF